MARVYVSSTIADLTEERRAVLDWLRLARHQAVDSYLPDSDTVRTSCLDDVAECDQYALILGHRYGFQPQRQVLRAREETLGAEHPATLAIRASLAYWTGAAGGAAGARDQYAALLPVRERILGAEHPDTVAARDNLAYWARRAQNPE